MRFKDIQIENFLIIEKGGYSLEDRGLVLISGENRDAAQYDSNGSGKTAAVVDALLWCLWGKTTRNISSDAVTRDAGRNCKVVVDFEDENSNEEYTVIRYRKDKQYKNSLRLFVNKQEVTGASNSDTQELVSQILGIDFITFLNSVVFSQSAIKRFTEMTDKEQKETLETILSLDWLPDALNKVRKEYDEVNRSLKANQDEQKHLQNQISGLTVRINMLIDKANSFDEDQDERVQALIDKREILVKKYRNLKRQFRKVGKSDIAELEKLVIILEDKIEKLKDSKASIKAVNAHVYAKSKLDKATYDLKLKQERIRNFHCVGPTCSTCHQKVSGQYRDTEKQLLEVAREYAEKLLRDRDNKYEEVGKERDEIFGGIYVAVAKYMVKLNKIKQDLALGHNKDIERVKLKAAVRYTYKQISELNKQIQSEQQQENQFDDLIEQDELKLTDLEDLVVVCQEYIDTLIDQRAILEFWKEGFSTKGIRSLILDGVVSYLNERLEEYTDILTGGTIDVEFTTVTAIKSGELRDKFSIKAVNQSGAQVYAANSAGERRRIDLCVAFALCDLVALRSDKRFNLLILDEVFDHLDEAGIDYVMDLLLVLSKEYESIFVITHNESLKSQFSNEIRVIREDGSASIEEK